MMGQSYVVLIGYEIFDGFWIHRFFVHEVYIVSSILESIQEDEGQIKLKCDYVFC